MSPPRNERLFELKWKDRTRDGGSGISELAPEWVAEQSRSVWVIDVRERDALVGPLGHIPGSTWVPLERVAEVPAKLGREVPVVLVSRSGRKAGRAALYLQALGMKYVAAMAGGMLAWKAAGFSTSRHERIFERGLEPHPLGEDPAIPLTPERIEQHVGDPSQVRWVRLAALLVSGKRSCVDGRDPQGVVGTPGGDAGELVLALSAIEAVTGQRIADAAIPQLLLRELDTFGRFYMHTDTHAWATFLGSVRGDPRLARGLVDPTDEAAWFELLKRPPHAIRPVLLEHLLEPANMGCGHLKLMLKNQDEYGVRPELLRGFLRAFYDLLWEGAPEVELATLEGQHDEAAILSVFVDDALWDFTPIPLVSPSVGRNQVFVAHPQVAARHREHYVEFFRRQGALVPLQAQHTEALRQELQQRGDRHLGQTLHHLANGLPLFEVHFEGTERVRVLAKGAV
jgi:rhodanese-related sulfurtransferase